MYILCTFKLDLQKKNTYNLERLLIGKCRNGFKSGGKLLFLKPIVWWRSQCYATSYPGSFTSVPRLTLR